MHLTDLDRARLDGAQGEAVRLATAILVDIGRLYDAEKMIPVSLVHDDSIFMVGRAQLDFAEHLVELGGRFAVPVSTNAANIDLTRWREERVSPEEAELHQRLTGAHLDLGAGPSFSCAPYQSGLIPRFGEHVAWAESNATIFANSVIGARTNRYAGLLELCAGLTGRVPYYGLHRDENRLAEIIFDLAEIPQKALTQELIWPLLGYAVGLVAEDRVMAVEGAPTNLGADHLKHFGAAAASSGSVAMFHLVGVTPEAPNISACRAGHGVDCSRPDLGSIREAEEALSGRPGDPDMIVLGCPHFSYQEFDRLARLLDGRKVHSNLEFWVFTGRAVAGWVESSRLAGQFKTAGIKIFTDGCAITAPYDRWNARRVLTNSAKFGAYSYQDQEISVFIGDLEDCVESGVRGRYVRGRKPWD